MQFSTTLSIFATLWTAVLASPMAEGVATVSNMALEKRADAGVFLCTDAGFSGRCVHIIQPVGECGMIPFFPHFLFLSHGVFDSVRIYSDTKLTF
jgi:hypothetical protein